MYCCAIVHMFVVIQYTIRPAGKLMMKTTKMSGSNSMSRCCILSALTVISRLDASWEPT